MKRRQMKLRRVKVRGVIALMESDRSEQEELVLISEDDDEEYLLLSQGNGLDLERYVDCLVEVSGNLAAVDDMPALWVKKVREVDLFEEDELYTDRKFDDFNKDFRRGSMLGAEYDLEDLEFYPDDIDSYQSSS